MILKNKKVFWIFAIFFLIIFPLAACARVDNLSSQSSYPSTKEFDDFTGKIEKLIASDKIVSILKLEYQIKTLPEFVVLRKLQTSILQTVYTAYDIGYISLCYASLDFNNNYKMKAYFSFLISLVELYNEASFDTISSIEKNLAINDNYLEKQYPDFANVLKSIKEDLLKLNKCIKDFSEENILGYIDISKYEIESHPIVEKRKRDIALANEGYFPPKFFVKYFTDFNLKQKK